MKNLRVLMILDYFWSRDKRWREREKKTCTTTSMNDRGEAGEFNGHIARSAGRNSRRTQNCTVQVSGKTCRQNLNDRHHPVLGCISRFRMHKSDKWFWPFCLMPPSPSLFFFFIRSLMLIDVTGIIFSFSIATYIYFLFWISHFHFPCDAIALREPDWQELWKNEEENKIFATITKIGVWWASTVAVHLL